LCRINLAPAKANLNLKSGSVELEMLEVETYEPIISCMASQYAGWNVKVKITDANGEEKTKYKCMGSGPARALAITEKELFEKLKYKDEYNAAVLVLESSKRPDEDVADYIAKKCKVAPNRTYLAYAPTASLAGSVQIAGRIVETSIHKFLELGMPPEWIKYGIGICPIAPVAEDDFKAMGWTNDCIIFAGNVTLKVEVPESDEGKLRDLVKKCPSNASKSYGKPFAQIFKDAGGDFYKIDPGVFAPARITVINLVTGNIFIEGDLNPTALDFS
jgi:methenyltetrahydromethanopterin cyclohydrolase